MGLTRKERIKRQRDREKDNQIDGGGLQIAAAPETKCDVCGKEFGTLYRSEGKLVCHDHVPVEKYIKPSWMFGHVVSGVAAIKKARRAMA